MIFSYRRSDIDIPLDNGFYRLKIGGLDLRKSGLRLDHVHLVSPYSKMEFAYKQPKHQDWFDVKVGNVRLNDVDIPRIFLNQGITCGGLWINDVLLQNLKNRKIPVEPHIVPMIYEGLQKAPVRFKIDTASVANFSVVYEELPVKGDKLGKLYFTDMNGQFFRFDQYRFLSGAIHHIACGREPDGIGAFHGYMATPPWIHYMTAFYWMPVWIA